MSPTAPLWLGMALGMRHALDADHIVAMGTIVARERSVARAARLGGAWGALCALRNALSHGMGLTSEKVGDTIHNLVAFTKCW
jgi:high-affinity nickel permease